MSVKYKLSINLIQHTPMIHFQFEHAGHTLRSSEFKPKLDRFLSNKIPDDKKKMYKMPVHENKVKGRAPALNYKVRISANDKDRVDGLNGDIDLKYQRFDKRSNQNKVVPDKFPCYFGNMGEDTSQYKQFSMHRRVLLEITSPHSDLLRIIEKNIGEFFIEHNFGTRQTKGFGSFYPEDINTYKLPNNTMFFDLDLSTIRKRAFQYLTKPTKDYFQMYQLFDSIRLFYATLRGGLNMGFGPNQYYFKSLIFLYAKQKLNATWEKKVIKQHFFKRELEFQKDSHGSQADILHFNGKNEYLMRELLGMSTSQQWKSYGNQITIKCLDANISRHTSPITFKPIHIGMGKYRVYLHTCEDGVAGILNKRFVISEQRGQKFEISAPSKGMFTLREFIEFAIKVDVHNHYKVFSGNPIEMEILDNIYRQLKNGNGE